MPCTVTRFCTIIDPRRRRRRRRRPLPFLLFRETGEHGMGGASHGHPEQSREAGKRICRWPHWQSADSSLAGGIRLVVVLYHAGVGSPSDGCSRTGWGQVQATAGVAWLPCPCARSCKRQAHRSPAYRDSPRWKRMGGRPNPGAVHALERAGARPASAGHPLRPPIERTLSTSASAQ